MVEEPKKTLYLMFDLTDSDTYSNVVEILKAYPGKANVVLKCEKEGKVYKLHLNVDVESNLKKELMCFVKPEYIVVK